MNFIENGEGTGRATLAATDYVTLLKPRTTLTINEIDATEISISTSGIATIPVSGRVFDPIADNMPRGSVTDGCADIDSVSIYLGQELLHTEQVRTSDSGQATFWKQHRSTGIFGPVLLQVRAVGSQELRVVTSRNAAGSSSEAFIRIDFSETLQASLIAGGFESSDGMNSAMQLGATVAISAYQASEARPFTLKMAGLDGDINDYRVSLAGAEFELNEKPEGVVLKGPSTEHFYAWIEDEPPFKGQLAILFYDSKTQRVQVRYSPVAAALINDVPNALQAHLKKVENQGAWKEIRKNAKVIPISLKIKNQPDWIAEGFTGNLMGPKENAGDNRLLFQRAIGLLRQPVDVEEMWIGTKGLSVVDLKKFWDPDAIAQIEQEGEGRVVVAISLANGPTEVILNDQQTKSDITKIFNSNKYDKAAITVAGAKEGSVLLRLQ